MRLSAKYLMLVFAMAMPAMSSRPKMGMMKRRYLNFRGSEEAGASTELQPDLQGRFDSEEFIGIELGKLIWESVWFEFVATV